MNDDAPSSGPLEAALLAAVSAATWLKPSDMGAVELAAIYARRIDHGSVEFLAGEIDSTAYNKVLYLGPHVLNTMKAIGLSPVERMKIMESVGPVKEADAVDDLKNRRRKREAG